MSRARAFQVAVHVLVLCLAGSLGSALAAPDSVPPLTLDQAMRGALARNPQVTAAQEAMAAALQGVTLARAGLAPTVLAAGTTSYGTAATGGSATSSTTTQVVTPVPTSPASSASVTLTATLPLYDGGHTRVAVEQAEATVAAAEATLRQTQQDIALSTAQAFLGVLKAERIATVREAQLAQAEAQLAQAQAQVRAGVAAQADVIQAQAQLAQAQVDLLGARAQIETAKVGLRGVLALDILASIEVQEPPTPPASVAMTPKGAVEEAEKHRPEIAAAAAAVQENAAAVELAYLNAGVQVNVGLNTTYVPASTTALTNNSASWLLTTTLSLPLYDGGKAQAGIDQAKANFRAAQAKLEAARQSVRQDAVQANLAAVQAAANVEATRAAAAAATEALRVAEGRYRAGVAAILEVTTARTQAAQAEVNAVTARYDYETALAALRHAVGGRTLGDGQ